MLIFKKASETASVLSPKKSGWDFSFPYFAFQIWKHIFFFSNKRMCLLSLGLARRQRRSQCVEGREGRWLIEHSSHWKEIQAEGLPGLSEAPPSQRRQWDLLSDRVRILFSRNLVAGPQFLLSSSPVWGWARTSGWASHAGVGMADTEMRSSLTPTQDTFPRDYVAPECPMVTPPPHTLAASVHSGLK